MKKIILFLIVFTAPLFAQDNIEIVRDRIAEINIGFLGSLQPAVNQINELEKLLISIDNKEFDLKRTIGKLNEFNSFLKMENNVDSLRKSFIAINNQFNTVACKYFYEKLMQSQKRKIVVLSTSISCPCTLEMCYKQEAEVQKFCKENPLAYDYAIIDTWTNSDIQNKYQAGFVPTVIELSEDNLVMNRFSRSEKLIALLKELIN